MYYGTFYGFARFEAAEFDTREELETWLRYEEPHAKAFGKDADFKRRELRSKKYIKNFLENPHMVHVTDMDGIRWHLYRPANKGESTGGNVI